ncbi:riboflavin biosynthesis protein RibF [Gammaproteobacteria bacterium 45_16_T64]|nr:riboflavin biosynthesis protein RibF [Gammaproteobacteria bacterium 45_16_T64]
MELIRGAYNLRTHHQGCVATIGNFDGVHLGHQAIIEQLLAKGESLSLPSVVILFEPQPREYFSDGVIPSRLMTVRDKFNMLASLGIDRVLCLRFDEAFCSLSAAEFCKSILVDGLGIKHLVVGDDFRFGNDRCGDFSFLQNAGASNGFSVEHTCTYEVEGGRVSSTRIRNALADGNIEIVKDLLGEHFSISGRVVHGDKIGRTIGVPTANVLLNRDISPVNGVFAVTVTMPEHVDVLGKVRTERSALGVANVGLRPTVSGTQMRLETHLFDFDEDIYGRRVSVSFRHKIRDEQKFSGLDALKAQIAEDILSAKSYFTQSN